MSWINSDAPDDMAQGRKNKLKGMGMEAAVQELMDEVEGSEDSISNVLDDAKEHLKQVYNVKKMFRVNDGREEITFRRQVSDVNSDIKLALDKSELNSDEVTIQSAEDSRKLFLGYRKCHNCGHMYPPEFCLDCGGAYSDRRFEVLKKIKQFSNTNADKSNLDSIKERNLEVVGGKKQDKFLNKIENIKACDWAKENKCGSNEWCNCYSPNKTDHYYDGDKCKNCRNGTYRKLRTEFATSTWNFEKSNIPLDDAVDYLIENDFITESSFDDRLSNQRLDTWRFNGEEVEIFESKNVEKTGLNYSNIAQVFYYIKALRKAGLDTTKDARIIYNGSFPERLEKSLTYFEIEYGYSIKPLSLEDWCSEKAKYIESIVIGKNVDGEKYSENGDYFINVTLSDEYIENPEIIIKSENEDE